MSNEFTQAQLDAPLDDDDYSFYSDLYKSDTGIRPRGHPFKNFGEFNDWMINRMEIEEHHRNPPKEWNESHSNTPFAELLAGVVS